MISGDTPWLSLPKTNTKLFSFGHSDKGAASSSGRVQKQAKAYPPVSGSLFHPEKRSLQADKQVRD